MAIHYLLDTHTFPWMMHAPDRLGDEARVICADAESSLALNLVSCWEMAIKLSIGKLTLNQPLREFLAEARTVVGINPLPIEAPHVLRVQHLPFHHRDPFDRLLVAQAWEDGLTLISQAPALDAYGVPRVW